MKAKTAIAATEEMMQVIIGRCKNLGYSGGDVSACHLNERVDKIFTASGLKKIIQVKE